MTTTESITVEGVSRTFLVRHPGGTPKDVVVWVSGGGTNARAFLSKIRVRADVIDIAPEYISPGAGWTKPYEASAPPHPDNLHDVQFMADILSWAKTTYGSTTRVWIAGHSSGGGLALCVWGSHVHVPYLFDGVAVVGSQMHLPDLNWDWEANAKPRTPFLLERGSLDDEGPPSEYFSVAETSSLVRSANGHTGTRSVAVLPTPCCSFSVSSKDGTGGTKPTRRTNVIGAGHSWLVCGGCHSDDHVIFFFRQNGLGL